MKKKMLIATAVLTIGSMIGVAALNAPSDTTAVDSPLIDQVDQQGKQLENHEGRITNTENDVKDLQGSTNTPPSTNKVAVPSVTNTPAPQPTPAPTPVTIVAYQIIDIPNSEDKDCKFIYTDGSVLQWHWLTVTYNQGTKFTNESGQCDNSVIGKAKSY